MISKRQIELANFIKATHEKLRYQSQIIGIQEAWKEHCDNEENLLMYAKAMEELATKYWEANSKDETSKAVSRIAWMVRECKKYFAVDLLIHREKDVRIARCNDIEIPCCNNKLLNTEKITVLDVGSCYNPLNQFNLFEVTAVDIAPANNTVYRCDFLSVEVCNKTHISENTVHALQANYFQVVVFSLVLEYLPSPMQRLLFCRKAYNLLVSEGILIIITPDSKQGNANMKVVKSWRYLLAEMGFSRIKQEKLSHINCMIFRKSLNAEIVKRWAMMHKHYKIYDFMAIPQDFNNISKNVDGTCYNKDNAVPDEERELFFSELPYCKFVG